MILWPCLLVAILGADGEPSMTGTKFGSFAAARTEDSVESNFSEASETDAAQLLETNLPRMIDPDSLLDSDEEEPALHQTPDATPVFQADFERDSDLNYDRWPDGWFRKRGTGYPPFAKVEIRRTNDALSGKHALCLSLDGGAIEISSPTIELHREFSYAAELWLKTEGLESSAARVSLYVTNDEGKTLVRLQSSWQRENNGWSRIHLGPLTPPEKSPLRGYLSVEVQPRTLPGDLQGKVWIDRVQLTRLPRMTLTTNSEHQMFVFPDRPRLKCSASGIQQANPQVEFVVVDAESKPVARHTTFFKTTRQASAAGAETGFVGTADWEPAISKVGFYRVRATMLGTSDRWLTRETTFVVVNPIDHAAQGEFGWSLGRGEEPLAVGPLSQLLLQSGVHHIRFPAWFDQEHQAHGDRLAWFAERLSMHNIELIGVLDQPPEGLRTLFRDKGELPAASVFADPDLWGPAVDPVMTRLSLKVRRWQLGSDQDLSFVGFPDLAAKVDEIRIALNRFGQNLKLALNWSWLQQVPAPVEGAVPWDALTYSADPCLTADELQAYLSRDEQGTRGECWVELEPLSANSYPLQVRIRDLVARMIAAKQEKAEIIFVSQPFENEHGLMRKDGTPGELFLPWRTTASLLGGSQFVGDFQLVGGSTNFVFARDGKAVTVVWNDRPTEETFQAEPGMRVLDVWGREIELHDVDGNGGKVLVGPTPIFITGMSEHLARWRIATNFKSKRLESIFGREQKLVLQLRNPFPQSVAGEVTLHAPQTWDYPKQPQRFRVAEGENFELEIPVSLSLDASGGAHQVRLDFDLHAEQRFNFTLFRTVYVGLEDVTVEAQTRLLDDDSLQLELSIHNQTPSPVSFNFTFFPPGRRRETKQLVNLPPGRTTTRIVFPNGADMVGQRVHMRAEELGGPRVFNQSVVAER